MNRRRRWPKGTWMQIVSADRLRSFVGPERTKKMSGRMLARIVDVHPSFIDHLLSGRRRSAKPLTAERIAEALQVPLDVLFVPSVSSGAAGRPAAQDVRRGMSNNPHKPGTRDHLMFEVAKTVAKDRRDRTDQGEWIGRLMRESREFARPA